MGDQMDEPSTSGRGWGDLLVASPWRIFTAVLAVAFLVEAGQGVLRQVVLPDLSGLAGIAVDLLWLPTLLGLFLWRAVVKPLHRRLEGEVTEIRRAETELRHRTDRLEFDGQLRRALETVEEETAVLAVVERAVGQAEPGAHTRLLLPGTRAESLEVAAAHVPDDTPGCCALSTAGQCPVIRAGQPAVYLSTVPLDTCPMLVEAEGELGAACHPITVLGETVGVLTTSFPAGQIPDEAARGKLESVAARTGSRLSLVRALANSRRQATTDALTRLVNRRALRTADDRARANGDAPSLLLCDLDHFKQLNDTHGHEAGDVALVGFADVLRSVVRPEDIPARVGGEEFAVLLPETTLDEGRMVAERLRRAQAATVGGRPSTTVSIGVAGPEAGNSLEELLRAADTALYAAKEDGRDTVVAANELGSDSVSHLHDRASGQD